MEPARVVGLHFQPGLPEQIVSDVLASSPDGKETLRAPVTVLPLLESTLDQLWRRRKDGFLTHEAYRRIGGVLTRGPRRLPTRDMPMWSAAAKRRASIRPSKRG
ncbi:hypothetical protein ACFYN3_41540 [Streptomyces lavendulae]|uniref:nSTAND1 domain-containing NTPase n=1 Tax=Streptomyces lavendulae TaxID=1914 RepID=UPI0033CC1D52